MKAHHGKATGDWEAVFGRRRNRTRALTLVRRVRSKGFSCAVIEREQHLYEIAIIGLHTQVAAQEIVYRGFRKGLKVTIAQS